MINNMRDKSDDGKQFGGGNAGGEEGGSYQPVLFALYGQKVGEEGDHFQAACQGKDDAKCEFAGAGADLILTVGQYENYTKFMVRIGELWFYAHTDGESCVIAKEYGYDARSGSEAYAMRSHDIMVQALEVGCVAITNLTRQLMEARKEMRDNGTRPPTV